MQIQHHPNFLHHFKDGIIRLIRLYSAVRIGSDSARIRLDADDACLVRFPNFLLSQFRTEIQRHEILDIRVDFFQFRLICKRLFCRGDWWLEVGLHLQFLSEKLLDDDLVWQIP